MSRNICLPNISSSYHFLVLCYHTILFCTYIFIEIFSCLFPLPPTKLYDNIFYFIALSLKHATLCTNVDVREPYVAQTAEICMLQL